MSGEMSMTKPTVYNAVGVTESTSNGRSRMALGVAFTEVEWRIYQILSDGLRHRTVRFRECLYDELSKNDAVKSHMSRMRKKLQPRGYDIVCEFRNKTTNYRLVRLLPTE